MEHEGLYGDGKCSTCFAEPASELHFCPNIGPGYDGDYISMLCDCCDHCAQECACTGDEGKPGRGR